MTAVDNGPFDWGYVLGAVLFVTGLAAYLVAATWLSILVRRWRRRSQRAAVELTRRRLEGRP